MPDPPLARPVLLVTGEYPPAHGGIGDYCAHLKAALERRGLAVAVATRRRPRSGSDDQPGVAPAEIRVVRGIAAWDVRALGWLARRAPARSVVHLQYQPAAFDLRGEICLAPFVLRALRPDVRVVTTLHDARFPYIFPGAGPLRAPAVRLLARTSHAVIAADPADLASVGVSPRRGHHVPIGSNVLRDPPASFDRADFRATLGLHADDLAVAYFGFLNASKGLDTLRAAFERIATARPDARLLLLGGAGSASDPTDERTAAAFLAALGPLAGRVLRPGYLAPHPLSAHLLAADVALLPYADGASLRRGSLLACAAHGLPIVSTTGRGLVPPLAGAVLARPPGDAAALAEAVLQLAASSAAQARLRAASATLATWVSWDRVAALHAEVYARLQ